MPAELLSWPDHISLPEAAIRYLLRRLRHSTWLARSAGRSIAVHGLPDWLEIVNYNLSEQPAVFAGYHSGPMWDLLKRDVTVLARDVEGAPVYGSPRRTG